MSLRKYLAFNPAEPVRTASILVTVKLQDLKEIDAFTRDVDLVEILNWLVLEMNNFLKAFLVFSYMCIRWSCIII